MNVKISDKDLGLKRILADMAKMDKKCVKVGVLGDAAAAPKEMREGTSDKTNVEVAYENEFGEGVPQRSFLRSSFDINSSKLQSTAGKLQDKIICGALNTDMALGQLGLRMQAIVQETITSGGIPYIPNSPATVMAKGSSSPLIDTGQLRQSISFVVVGNSKK